ncbi:MAG: hypothetical protein ACRC62_08905 [Microcoleus sp.]
MGIRLGDIEDVRFSSITNSRSLLTTINYQLSTKRAGTGAPPLPLNSQLSTLNSQLSTTYIFALASRTAA